MHKFEVLAALPPMMGRSRRVESSGGLRRVLLLKRSETRAYLNLEMPNLLEDTYRESTTRNPQFRPVGFRPGC